MGQETSSTVTAPPDASIKNLIVSPARQYELPAHVASSIGNLAAGAVGGALYTHYFQPPSATHCVPCTTGVLNPATPWTSSITAQASLDLHRNFYPSNITHNAVDLSLGDPNLGDPNLGAPNLGDSNLGDSNLGDPNLGDSNLGGTNLGDMHLGDAPANDASSLLSDVAASVGAATLGLCTLTANTISEGFHLAGTCSRAIGSGIAGGITFTWDTHAGFANMTGNGVAYLTNTTGNGVAYLSTSIGDGITFLTCGISDGIASVSQNTGSTLASYSAALGDHSANCLNAIGSGLSSVSTAVGDNVGSACDVIGDAAANHPVATTALAASTAMLAGWQLYRNRDRLKSSVMPVLSKMVPPQFRSAQ